MDNIIRFKTASLPDVVDMLHKTIYSSKELDKLKNSERTKELLKNHTLWVKSCYDRNGLASYTDLDHTIGYVVYWGDGYIDVDLDDKTYNYFKDKNVDDYRIGMATVGELEDSFIINNTKVYWIKYHHILNFVIQFKNCMTDPQLGLLSNKGYL